MPTTISVTAHSKPRALREVDPPPPVSVKVNGVEVWPKSVLLAPTTFRLIIFIPNSPPTDPQAYLFDKVLCTPMTKGKDPWSLSYGGLFDFAHNLLYSYGDPRNLFFLFATAGFDQGMVPPPSFAQLLFSCGAGSGLQDWLGRTPGQSDQSMWVSKPANYIFIGSSGTSFKAPLLEKFEAGTGDAAVTTKAECTF